MNKKDLELFRQAIDEGISNRFDKLAAACTEEIVCSEKHNLAMRAIIYGKVDTKRTWSPRMKRIVAILVAAALLLTSCGIIFRNEIREVFEEFFVKLSFDSDDYNKTIEEIYVLTYLPEGYALEKENISNTVVTYIFVNSTNDRLFFEQRVINGSDFIIDNESGYSIIQENEKYKVYYRFTGETHIYIWNDEKYSMSIKSSVQLSNEDIILLFNGITIQ